MYLIGACYLATLAFTLNGPSETLNFANQPYLMAIGHVFTGMAISQLVVLTLPEIML